MTLRPYVLACARQAALDRADAAGRADRPGAPSPAPLAGLGPDGEVVLSSLEHHVARGALAALPERSRTALWLFDVEAMTPAEVAGILGGTPEEIAALAGSARAEVRAAQQAAFGRHEVRAGCRFTVEHLDAYRAAALEPGDGLIVRSHLDRCPPCRMRHGELADAPATLAAAVPAAPLLGGETQQHWLVSAPGLRPAERLLAPGLAAAGGAGQGPAHRIPDVLRRAGRVAARSWRPAHEGIDVTTAEPAGDALGSATAAGPAGAPDPAVAPAWTAALRWSGSFTPLLPADWTLPPALAAGATEPAGSGPARSGPAADAGVLTGAADAAGSRFRLRGLGPVVTAGSLVAAWLVTMLAVPWLMTPGTAPGPDGMALPAVQAYVNGLLPDATAPASSRSAVGPQPFFPGGAPAAGGPAAATLGSTDVPADALGAADAGPVRASVVTAASSSSSDATVPHGTPVTVALPTVALPTGAVPNMDVPNVDVPAIVTPALVPVPVAPAVVPVSVVLAPATPPSATSAGPGTAAHHGRPVHPGKPGKSGKASAQAGTPAVVPDRPGPTTTPTPARRPARRPGRQPRITTA